MIYALDSNIISYILKKDEPVRTRFRQESDKGHEFAIVPVVYYEVKRGLLSVNSKKKLQEFENLYQVFAVEDLHKNIWDKAIQLYVALQKKGRLIDDADLLIAAFCLVRNYTLVTNNTKHFADIAGLAYTNWKI